MKTQLVVNKATLEIISLDFSKWKTHDFKLLKESKLKIKEEIVKQMDSWYQWVQNEFINTEIPKKWKDLTKEEKEENKKLSSSRIFVEHVIWKLKIFKILSEKYRNRRKRFSLRWNLIAWIYNFEKGLT
jgi:hypothetical protein